MWPNKKCLLRFWPRKWWFWSRLLDSDIFHIYYRFTGLDPEFGFTFWKLNQVKVKDKLLFFYLEAKTMKIRETRLGLHCRTPLIPYPLSNVPYPLSLTPSFWSLSPSTVPFNRFRWGLFLSSLLSLSLLLLSQVKVKSTPSPRPKTGVWQYWKGPLYEQG